MTNLQKAFDKVWKDGLLIKLLRYGIKGNMYQWTKAYLHNRRARVQVAAWADSWSDTINRDKTTATLFTLSTKAKAARLTLGDTMLKLEDQQT